MVEVNNKVVIVTGATQGLGKCIAENLLKGYVNTKVVVIGRNEELMRIFENELIDSERKRVLFIKGDVRDKSTISKTINKTIEKFGTIDSVVFNAGVIEPVGHLDEPNYDILKMKELFDVNFFSIVSFINELLVKVKDLKKENEPTKLIFVSSGASTRGIDGWLAYGSSKAAVNQLCKQIHDEMYPKVKCLSIAPGVVNTNMQKTIRDKIGNLMNSSSHSKFIELYEKGELLDGQLVGKVYAEAAVHECSDEAVYGEYLRWNDPRLAKQQDQ